PEDAGECEAFVRQAFEGAREYLDFFPIVYYPAHFIRNEQGFRSETVGYKDYYAKDWRMICDMVKQYHQPGEFVTFAGYEWTGDRTRWGDHNVFYPFDDPPLDLSLHIEDLYANLREVGGIAIPHHTAYAFANRGKDWSHYDEDVSPFGEIFSVHGSSEGCNTPFTMTRNGSMAPRVSMNSIQAGLDRGYRLGIIASGDNGGGFAGKWGIGLMAALAEELTRESLWEAFMARRVYGVTGDRIRLGFSINDAPMGSVLQTGSPLTISASVECTEALDRIEIIKNGRVVYTHNHNGTWQAPAEGTVRCKIPVQFGWGPTASYGFEVGPKQWQGRLRLAEGQIVSVEGCFTRHGNSWEQVADNEVQFSLTTDARRHAAEDTAQQRLVFEVEAPVDAVCVLECDRHRLQFTPAEAMRRSGLIVYDQESRERIREQFGDQRGRWDDLRDAVYHNAHIIKRHVAIPRAGYTASATVRDAEAGPGRNYYYLRVSQLNGQYAWSSPIWIDV
ncbi:MAG: DUF3604 domain-containing protein, partial [Armatimonadota bacterium]